MVKKLQSRGGSPWATGPIASTMITITIFLLLLVATTGLYAGYTNFIVQEDARIINELGKIRGGVQRLVHLC